MGEFGATSVSFVVHAGEIVLETDPAANWDHGAECGSQRTVFGILSRIVADEERAPIKEEATCFLSSTYNGYRVGAVAIFRTCFTNMLGSFLDMAKAAHGISAGGRRFEPAGSFVGARGACCI
jgi:hypothetical protein